MSFIGTLLEGGLRHPASCLIQVGRDVRDIGGLAQLVASVEVQVARGEAGTGTIVIVDRRDENGRWTAADSGFFQRWAPIRITADFQTRTEEVFRGYITQMRPSFPQNAGDAKLELLVQDESAALDRGQIRDVWGKDGPVSDLEILTELVLPLGLEPHPLSASGQSSRPLAQNATAIRFLRERARANGYELIFSGGRVYFGPMRLHVAPQPPLLLYAGTATNCLSLQVADDAQKPDAVGFELAPRESGDKPIRDLLKPNLDVLGNSASAAEGSGLPIPSVWRISKEGDETEEEVRARAQALVNEHSFKSRATGELDGALYAHVLQVALPVSVDGAGSRYGGLYYVDKVVHAFKPEGYRQRFELIRNGDGETGSPRPPASPVDASFASLF